MCEKVEPKCLSNIHKYIMWLYRLTPFWSRSIVIYTKLNRVRMDKRGGKRTNKSKSRLITIGICRVLELHAIVYIARKKTTTPNIFLCVYTVSFCRNVMRYEFGFGVRFTYVAFSSSSYSHWLLVSTTCDPHNMYS